MPSRKLVLLATALIVSIGFSAASPASLTIFPEQSSTRINSFTSYEVQVENAGPVKDVYRLSSQSQEVRIAPTEVELEPDQEETVNVWYNPKQTKEEGTYSFTVTATSRANSKQYSVDGTADVIKDHQVSISVEDTKTACLDEKATYTVEVENQGIQKEEFKVTTEFGELSRNSVSLEEGETKELTLTASSSEPTEKNFNVVAASKTSYAQDIESTGFTSEVCYASEMSADTQEKEVAAFTEEEYEITVRNTGTRQDTFTLSTSTGELEDTEITVNGESSESTTLTVSPSELGTQTTTVTAEGKSSSQVSVTSQVFNGMDMEMSFRQDSRNVCETETAEYDLQVENTGAATETYTLETSLGELEDNEIELDPGETETLDLGIDSSEVEPGNQYTLEATATASTFEEPQRTVTADLNAENCHDLNMNVVPKVASAGENSSVIFEIRLENTGTRENTYNLSYEGPEWISIKPEEQTVAPGETEISYMYAGIPFEKKGEVKLNATAKGVDVERSEEVTLAIGKDIEEAIRSDENQITGNFAERLSGLVAGIGAAANTTKLIISIIAGLVVTSVILFWER